VLGSQGRWGFIQTPNGGQAPPRADPRPSQVHCGFDGQPPRGSDIFGLGMWHGNAPDPPRSRIHHDLMRPNGPPHRRHAGAVPSRRCCPVTQVLSRHAGAVPSHRDRGPRRGRPGQARCRAALVIPAPAPAPRHPDPKPTPSPEDSSFQQSRPGERRRQDADPGSSVDLGGPAALGLQHVQTRAPRAGRSRGPRPGC
jgi:hypothetical protein